MILNLDQVMKIIRRMQKIDWNYKAGVLHIYYPPPDHAKSLATIQSIEELVQYLGIDLMP
jgi:hypothetical protein